MNIKKIYEVLMKILEEKYNVKICTKIEEN